MRQDTLYHYKHTVTCRESKHTASSDRVKHSRLSRLLLAGLIRLRSSPPPRLQGVQYVLNVTATDDNVSGGPQALSSTAQVIVGVDDVNNNKPVFEKVR